MRQEHLNDIQTVPTVLDDAVPTAGAISDDTGEASFPASDPPASWTWDVAGRPPGSATG